MLALLALIAAATAGSPAGAGAIPADPPVELSLNGGDYRPGDPVRVEVATGEDGYLLVLRADGEGYLRVLFPIDPDLDPFVRGNRRYAVQGRGDDASFLADDRGGTGTIVAILSREPFAVGDYAVGTHWDYDRLRLDDPYGDVEAQLLAIARRMTDNGRFDYDIVGYRVWGPGYESEQPVVVAGGGWADPYFNTCLACGWRSPGFGISIGTGWYDPWFDPWFGGWNSWRNPYGFNNWGYSGWNGWWGWDPYWGSPYRPITVINTPLRPVVPNPIYGTRARVPQGGIGTPVGTGRRVSEPAARPQPSPSNTTRARGRGEPSPSAGSGARPSSTSGGGGASAPRPSSPAPSSSGRSRGRPGNEIATPAITPRVGTVETRRTEERPVYRPPTPVATPRNTPVEVNRGSRTASSPPPRREAPSRPQASAPSRSQPRATPSPSTRSAPPSRPSSPSRAPATRSAPPSRPSTPSPSAGRSAPTRSAPAPSAPSRSRSRGPN